MDHNLNVDKIYNIRNILHVSAYKAISRCPFKKILREEIMYLRCTRNFFSHSVYKKGYMIMAS